MKNIQQFIDFLVQNPSAYDKLPRVIKNTPEIQKWYDGKKTTVKNNYDDYDTCMKLVTNNGMNLERCSEKIRKDREICTKAASDQLRALEFCDKTFLDDKDFVLTVYKAYYKKLEGKTSYVYHMDSPFQCCSDKVRSDKDVCLYVASVDEYAFKRCSDDMKDDNEVALVAVKKCGLNLEYCSARVREIPEIYQAAFTQNVYSLKWMPDHIRNNKEWCMKAVSEHSYAYEHCGESCRDDEEIATAAIKKNCYNFKYCSERLRSDENLIKLCINNGGFTSCPFNVKNTKEWCVLAIKENNNNYKYCSDAAKKNKEIVLYYLESIINSDRDKKWQLEEIPLEAYEDSEVSDAILMIIS